MEALRRRVEELELENALMREVVEVVKKDPGADLRRLSNREKTMPVDRLRPRYSLRSMACLLRIAPSSYHYHHARIDVDKYTGLRARVARAFADSKGRYGYRRVKAALGTGVSEKVIRRLMAEGGLSAHVPKRRRYSSYEGETTPAPGNLVNRDFTAERPNEKWLTDITEIKARDGKVYLSPMIDCHDGKIVAYTACFHPNAELANRMLAEAAETLPDNARPVVHSDRGMPLPVARMAGAHGTLRADALNEREGLQPRQRRRGGILRSHEDGVRLSRALGETHPRRGACPDRRVHPLAQPRAHQTVAGLDESGTISSKPRNGCMTISKKTSAAPTGRLR